MCVCVWGGGGGGGQGGLKRARNQPPNTPPPQKKKNTTTSVASSQRRHSLSTLTRRRRKSNKTKNRVSDFGAWTEGMDGCVNHQLLPRYYGKANGSWGAGEGQENTEGEFVSDRV